MTIDLPLEAASSRGWTPVPFSHPAFLTLTDAGDMREPDRRDEALRSIGLEPGAVRRVRQVHSRRVVTVDDIDATAPALLEADGIVSPPGGPFLAVSVADCVPIYVADLATGAYALLHSGWRGTGVLESAVNLLQAEFGSRAADLAVLLGPCISSRAYEVDEARAREYSVWGPDAVVHRDGNAYLDMHAANRAIARRLGIRLVSAVNHCTYATPHLGSYRREGSGSYTSMLALLGAGVRTSRSGKVEEV
ncbi:MAG: polyphenol oxidase family protein [Spirochaetota bacterium]